MAISLRELSLPVQFLLFVVLAVILIGVGLYAPFSPVKQKAAELEALEANARKLANTKSSLQDAERQKAALERALQAVQNEIDNLRKIIPADKETDEFIRSLQSAAAGANVTIRRLKTLPVASGDQYYEMPFEVDVDGPYYAVSDFFARLSQVSRIINVGDLTFKGTAEGTGRKYPIRPGTTITGTFIAKTFFTKAEEQAPATQAAPQPAKR